MALKEGNRFFRPSVAQYTPQFVEEPYPVDELLQEGRRDQQKRDQTLGMLGQMTEYLQVNAHPSQEDFKTDLLQNYYGRVDKLASDLSEGANPDQILGSLTKINRDWQTDERRRELETGFEQGKIFDQTKRQMMSQNKFRPWLSGMEDVFQANQQGEFTPIRFEGMESFINPQPSALQALGQVAKSGSLKNFIDVDPESGIMTTTTQGRTGLTPARLQAASESAADAWLDSDAGRQRALMLISQNPDVTDDQILKNATDYIYNLGANQLGMSTRDLTDIDFPSEGKETEGVGPPQYERLFEEEADIPLPLAPKDIKKKILKGEGSTSVSQGYGATFKAGEAERGYPTLSKEKQDVYEKIVRAVDPTTANMSPDQLTEHYKSDEAHAAATEYLEGLQDQIIAPSVNVAPFEREADYNFAKRQIQVNTSGRVFYDAEKQETVKPDTRKWRKLNARIQKDEFEVQGDMDYKNFVTLRTGNDNFASSWSVKLVDEESGREKQYVVTKKASDLEGERGSFEKEMNRVFTKTMQLPGVPTVYEYETQSGKKQPTDITYLPQHQAWEVKLRNPYKDRRIAFYTNQLGDISDRIALEMQKINAE